MQNAAFGTLWCSVKNIDDFRDSLYTYSMSSISNVPEMSTAMSNQQVRQEAAVNILDSSLDTAQAQADQLIQMMEFKDPMVGNLVDVKA